MNSKTQYKILFVTVLTIVLSFVNFFNLYQTFDRALSNDECLWVQKKQDNGEVIFLFEKVKVNGVTYNAGIRDNDKLIAINGIKLKDPSQAQMIINKIGLGEYANYTIEQNGKIKQVKVYIKKLVNPAYLANALFSLFFLFIGYIVYKAKPSGNVQILFYLIGAFLSVATSVNGFFGFYQPELFKNTLFQLYVYIWVLAYCFVPSVYIHFFFVFPTRVKIIDKKWFIAILYGISVLLFIISLYQVIFYMYKDYNFSLLHLNKIAGRIGIYQVTAMITGFITLTIRNLKSKDEHKKPLRIILMFYVFGFLGFIFTTFIAPAISDTIFNSPEYYMPIILVATIPIGFAYAIFKYQLMDVSVVIRNTLYYGAATITIAVFYFLAVYGLGQVIGISVGTEYKNIIAAVTFLVFALIFQSTKDKFQNYLTRKFYPEQFAYEEILLKFSNELSGTFSVDKEAVINAAADTFVHALKLNKFGIIIKDKEGNFNLVKNVGINNLSSLNKNDAIQVNDYINSSFGLNNRYIIEEVNFNFLVPSIAKSLFEEKIFTVVPLIVNNNLIGLMLFGLKYSGSKFNEKDIELLNAAARQVAISFENARLYESEAEKVKLEQELELARNIQQNLLPKKIPVIKGLDIYGRMIPAMQVGGDYFDVIKLSDTKVLVIVGDVSGKGLSAALYMAKLQTILQLNYLKADKKNNTINKYKQPIEILREVNSIIYEVVERNAFITIGIILIDTEINKLFFCRAGHLPLIIINEQEINYYKPSGIAVGLDKGEIFNRTLEQIEITLKKGDIITLVSDGVTETFNEKKEMFGETLLSQNIQYNKAYPASKIFETLTDNLRAFRGSQPPYDDITGVIIKVE